MTIGKIFAVAIVVLAVSGCATVTSYSTIDEPSPRLSNPSDHRVVLVEDGVVEQPHKIIGSVGAKIKLAPTSKEIWPRERIIERLKSEARLIGGDGIVGLEIHSSPTGGNFVSPDGTFLQGNSELWTALVFVWIEGE